MPVTFTADDFTDSTPQFSASDFSDDKSPATSAGVAFGREAAIGTGSKVVPGFGAWRGGLRGAKIGAGIGQIIGGGPEDPFADIASGILGVGGALVGAAIGGWLADKAQREVIKKAAPNTYATLQHYQQEDLKDHPVAAALGNLVGNFAGAIPAFKFSNPVQAARGAAAIYKIARGAATTDAEKILAKNLATQVGYGVGGGIVAPLIVGQKPTAGEITQGIAQTLLFGTPRFGGKVPEGVTDVRPEAPPKSESQQAQTGQRPEPPGPATAPAAAAPPSPPPAPAPPPMSKPGPVAPQPATPKPAPLATQPELPVSAAPTPKTGLIPALLVDGKPVTGGNTHAEVFQNIIKNPATTPEMLEKIADAQADDSKHVFVDENGKIYSRKQAEKLFAKAGGAVSDKQKGLTSEDLIETPKAPQAIEPKTAAAPTAEEVLAKGYGSLEPQQVLDMPESEYQKLVSARDESGLPQWRLTQDATEWAMAHPKSDIAQLQALQKQAFQRQTANFKAGISTLDRSQWFGDAIHALRQTEVGKKNVASVAVRSSAKAFDKLALEHAIPERWTQNPDALYLNIPENTGLGTGGIKAKILQGHEMTVLRRNVAKDLGLDPEQISNPTYRAAALDKLKAHIEGKYPQPETQDENFKQAVQTGAQKVPASQLKVGDVLMIKGEPVEVTDIDPDTDDVTLKDGSKFGTQTLKDGTTVLADEWHSTHETPFELEPPETVGQQNRRLEQEQRQREQNETKLAQAEKVRLKAQSGLGGNLGSAGQGKLFPESGQQEIFQTTAPQSGEELRETPPQSAARSSAPVAPQSSFPAKTQVALERTLDLRNEWNRVARRTTNPDDPQRESMRKSIGAAYRAFQADALNTILDSLKVREQFAREESRSALAKVRDAQGNLNLKAFKHLPAQDIDAVFHYMRLESAIADAQRQLDSLPGIIYPHSELRVLGIMERAQREALSGQRPAIAQATETPAFPPGPGAQTRGEPDYPAISLLTDQITTAQRAAPGPAEKLSVGDRLADAWAAGKSAVEQALARTLSVRGTLSGIARGVRTPTELDQRLGVLDRILQTSVGRSMAAGKAMKTQVPSGAMRDAAILYLDSGSESGIPALKQALQNLPAGTSPRVRRAIQTAINMPEAAKDLASSIEGYYSVRGQEALDEGVLKNLLEDYATHIWAKDANSAGEAAKDLPQGLKDAISNGRISTYFQFGRQRKIGSILEGIMQGKKPELDSADIIPYYNYQLDRAIASRQFIKDATESMTASDGRPMFAPSGVRKVVPKDAPVKEATLLKPRAKGFIAYRGGRETPEEEAQRNAQMNDYKHVDHPAMKTWRWAATDENGNPIFYEADLMVHPEGYERIARIMDKGRLTPTKTVRTLLSASTQVKGFKLGLFSLFHPVHVGSHALFHWTNPFKQLRGGDLDFDSPDVAFAIEKGHLKVAPSEHELNNFADGVLNNKLLIQKIPFIGTWSRANAEWTFKQFIPKLKVATFLNAYRRNIWARDNMPGKLTGLKGLSDDEIASRVGDSVNNAYGELNHWFLGKQGRDPRFQRLLRGIFLAPDFGEARLRFVQKALTKTGFEERMALATMFITFYLGARVANMLANGDPQDDWKHAFEVKVGNHWWGMRSVLGDMNRMFADSGRFFYSRLNPLYTRTLSDWLFGRDPSGLKLSPTQKFITRPLEQLVPIQLGGLTRPDQQVWESFVTAMGLQTTRDYPQADIDSLIDKFKRNSKDPKLQHEWQRSQQETFGQSDYAPLRYALTLDNAPQAFKEYQKLIQLQGKTRPEIFRALNPNAPLTHSARLEVAFKKSLDADGLKKYQAAKAQQKEIFDRFKATLNEFKTSRNPQVIPEPARPAQTGPLSANVLSE